MRFFPIAAMFLACSSISAQNECGEPQLFDFDPAASSLRSLIPESKMPRIPELNIFDAKTSAGDQKNVQLDPDQVNKIESPRHREVGAEGGCD